MWSSHLWRVKRVLLKNVTPTFTARIESAQELVFEWRLQEETGFAVIRWKMTEVHVHNIPSIAIGSRERSACSLAIARQFRETHRPPAVPACRPTGQVSAPARPPRPHLQSPPPPPS
ncbi:unnamed protein product [Allacma fusca]|uniref:Uncharacterized protein n=1 Tax=Allacma fusca TaxID=39272 RepID=A0A8J2JV68_9HEXA|nr:unnamed protein product [Allacma fusca]